jgi:uncharacterized membrane protein YqjE
VEPNTVVFSKTSPQKQSIISPAVQRVLSRILSVLGGLCLTVCVLLWIWKGDNRWGATGAVLFVALVAASAMIAPPPRIS